MFEKVPERKKFGFQAWLPTIGLAFAAFVFNTSEFLPVGLLPNIAESIHESVSKTGLIITVYAWMVSLLSLPLTILTARLERRRLLLWLIFVFALSHFAVLWADTFEKLMGARICVAVTHSVFWSIMTPLAARVAPFGRQSLGLAMVMGGTIVATVMGVPLGTHLGQMIGWRGAFFVIGIAAAVIWLITYRVLPVCISDRAGSLKSLPGLFRRPALVQLYLLTMIVILGQFTVYSFITPILINVAGMTESQTVSVLFVFGLSGILGTVLSAKCLEKHFSASLLIPMVLLTLCLALLVSTSTNPVALYLLVVVWGACISSVSMAFQTLLLNTARDAADVATSMFSGIFNIGIGGGAFIGSYVSASLGFSSVPYIGAALVGVCALVCLIIYLVTGSAVIGSSTRISKE